MLDKAAQWLIFLLSLKFASFLTCGLRLNRRKRALVLRREFFVLAVLVDIVREGCQSCVG